MALYKIPSGPLAECRHKLVRAHEHFRVLDEEIRNYFKSDPYFITRTYDRKQSRYIFVIKHLKPLPNIKWALILGNSIHNARSALDYIAWRLAGSDPNNQVVLFPICLRPNDFNSVHWRLKGIHPDAVTEIAGLQPYSRPQPQDDPLWILQELDARDKHKLLAPVWTYYIGSNISIYNPTNPDGTIDISKPGISDMVEATQSRADDDAQILELVVSPASETDPQVNMNTRFIVDIVFERIGANYLHSIQREIPVFLQRVEDVVARFEGLLSTNPHWIGL